MVEIVPTQQRLISTRFLRSLLIMLSCAPLGCLATSLGKKGDSQVASQTVLAGRLATTWDHKVKFVPDVSRGGSVFPGLLARVYLMDEKFRLYNGDGSLEIQLYDSTVRDGKVEPKLTDVMKIDPVTLKKFIKKDIIGNGYTILFPWYNYSPKVKQVFIQVQYTSASNQVLHDQSGTFTVDHTETYDRIRKGMPLGIPADQQLALPKPATPTPPLGLSAPQLNQISHQQVVR